MLNVGDDHFTTLCFVQLNMGFVAASWVTFMWRKEREREREREREYDSKGEDQQKKKYTAEIKLDWSANITEMDNDRLSDSRWVTEK
jgi:hypothetical protein